MIPNLRIILLLLKYKVQGTGQPLTREPADIRGPVILYKRSG